MNKRLAFRLPMRKGEKIAGWLWLPIHIFLLSFAVALLHHYVLAPLGIVLSNAHLNFLYYAISFAFVLIFMFRFLRESFSHLCDNFIPSLQTLIIGYFFYYFSVLLVSILMGIFMENLVNPNSEVVITETKLNSNVMIAVSVLLAPVVEEALFRGIAFGTLRRKSRLVAYLFSVVLFAVYHLWDSVLVTLDWSILLYCIQYVPGGIVLAWAYEKSGNIWTSIFLHMVINGVSMYATINF